MINFYKYTVSSDYKDFDIKMLLGLFLVVTIIILLTLACAALTSVALALASIV